MPDDDIGRLVFGTAALGLPYGLAAPDGRTRASLAESHAIDLVVHAMELGIATFDSAPAYGLAEQRLGLALANRGAVWTKVSASEDAVTSIEESLRNLRRHRLDLVQWHNWTARLADESGFRRAWELLAGHSGVAALGASTYGISDARAAIASRLFGSVQIEWSILNRAVLNAVAAEAERNDVKLVLRSVLLQGALTSEGRLLPNRPALVDGVRRARRLATELGVSVEHLAIRGALDQRCASVIVGFDRHEQLDGALRAATAARIDSGRLTALDMSPDESLDPRTWPVKA